MASPNVTHMEIDTDYHPFTWYFSQIRDLFPDQVFDNRVIFFMDEDLNTEDNMAALELIKYYGLTYNEAIKYDHKTALTFKYLYPERLRLGNMRLRNVEHIGPEKPVSMDCDGSVILIGAKPSSLLTEGK